MPPHIYTSIAYGVFVSVLHRIIYGVTCSVQYIRQIVYSGLIGDQMSENKQAKKKYMFCINCGHEFFSTVENPRCGKCQTYRVIEHKDASDKKDVYVLRQRLAQLEEEYSGTVKQINELAPIVNRGREQLDAMEPIRAALADDTILRKSDVQNFISVDNANRVLLRLIDRVEVLESAVLPPIEIDEGSHPAEGE